MFRISFKRPLITVAVSAGLLTAAGPASAGTAVGSPEDLPSGQAHSPAAPKPSSGGHPSQGAPTVGGGTTTKTEPYESPTPSLDYDGNKIATRIDVWETASLKSDKNEVSIETIEAKITTDNTDPDKV